MKKIFMVILGFLLVASVSFAADVQKRGERTFTSTYDLSIDQSVVCDTDLTTTFCSGIKSRTYVNSQNIRFYVSFWASDINATYSWLYFISDASGTIVYHNLNNIQTLGSTSTRDYYPIYVDAIIAPGEYTLTSLILDSAGSMAISQPHRFTAY